MPDDKIQREIEDILARLDDFVPEESVADRMRRRSSDAAGSFGRAVLEPFARISLRHVMLASIALILIGFVAGRATPVGQWMLIGGVILFITTFALSFFARGGGSTPAPEKRWRGRPMQLESRSLGNRFRAWLNAKRRPR